MVYAVRPSSLLIFVPSFHLKGSVHLTDRAGLVRLPLTAPGQDTDDAFAVSQRRQFRLDTGDDTGTLHRQSQSGISGTVHGCRLAACSQRACAKTLTRC